MAIWLTKKWWSFIDDKLMLCLYTENKYLGIIKHNGLTHIKLIPTSLFGY
jgi:hypothetical protein